MNDELLARCRSFIDEQSCGEWDDKAINEDAAKLYEFVQREAAFGHRLAAQSPEPVACIRLRPDEIQSGLDRVRWAEGLIRQLPDNHDGRNSWLANYAGDKHDADKIRFTAQADYEQRIRSALVNAPLSSDGALREALERCRNYIVSPLRMSNDDDEKNRRDDIVRCADEALASLSCGEARERIARVIAGPLCDATNGEHSIMAQGNYRFCTQCGETISRRTTGIVEARNKADAILATGCVPGEASIRADEREKCAEIADCMADEYDATSFTSTNADQVAALRSKEQAAHEIAAAIRAGRGEA